MSDISDPLRVNATFALKLLGYTPTSREHKIDYALINSDKDALLQMGENVIPRLLDYLGSNQFGNLAVEVIAEIGKVSVKYLLPLLAVSDEKIVKNVYDCLVKIDYDYREMMDMGNYDITDAKGLSFQGSNVESLGQNIFISHSCPVCKGDASTGRPLVWILSKCVSKGFADFNCQKCETKLKIPSTIFRPKFLSEAKKSDLIRSTISEYSISEILVANWGEVIFSFNTGQNAQAMIAYPDIVIEELSLESFISDDEKQFPQRANLRNTECLTTIYMLSDNEIEEIEALEKRAISLWGFDSQNSKSPVILSKKTENLRDILSDFDENNIQNFLAKFFDITIINDIQFEKTLLKVKGKKIFMLGQVEPV